MEAPLRHLDITDEYEAGTLCGALPWPDPSDETLTDDPSAVTCADCQRTYAVARMEHLVFGKTAEKGALAEILQRQDAPRPTQGPTPSAGDVVDHRRHGRGRVAVIHNDVAFVLFDRGGHSEGVPIAELQVVATVHLDVAANPGEIATACGSFPEPHPSQPTLTRDPALANCPTCLAAYAKRAAEPSATQCGVHQRVPVRVKSKRSTLT